jgi:NitT/TauT family transport system ATP-binding protein
MQPASDGLTARAVDMVYRRGDQTTEALRSCTLSIPQGGWGTLLGPSGCGKSTLLRIFADIVKPTRGHVALGANTPSSARATRSFALVSQQSVMLPWRKLLANVELGLEVAHVEQRERRQRAEHAIELVGLRGFERAYPFELSGGMRQRAAIARAIALRPQYLLLDEPFGALDEITREKLNFELIRILKETSATMLLVTHSISEAVILSDSVYVMSPRPGRIVREVAIDFGRDRSPSVRDDPRFADYEAELRHALAGPIVASEAAA